MHGTAVRSLLYGEKGFSQIFMLKTYVYKGVHEMSGHTLEACSTISKEENDYIDIGAEIQKTCTSLKVFKVASLQQ
jgi:hypothetical protein